MEKRPSHPGAGEASGDLVSAPNPDLPWRVQVDEAKCIGSGSCVGVAPFHFQLIGYLAAPVREFVTPDEDVLAAADSCPAEAISVFDTVKGESLATGP